MKITPAMRDAAARVLKGAGVDGYTDIAHEALAQALAVSPDTTSQAGVADGLAAWAGAQANELVSGYVGQPADNPELVAAIKGSILSGMRRASRNVRVLARIAEEMWRDAEKEIVELAAAPQPPEVGQNAEKMKDVLHEGLEILTSLISNIKRHGNYSPEATCTFIDQAGGCLRNALRLVEIAAPQAAPDELVRLKRALQEAVWTLNAKANQHRDAMKEFAEIPIDDRSESDGHEYDLHEASADALVDAIAAITNAVNPPTEEIAF